MKPEVNRTVSMEANLKVEVLDLQRRRVANAKVEVTDEQSKKISARLNATSAVFEATLNAPGLYSIHVALQEHESQTRKVQVNPGEHQETFVLGKEGMPFYYRGRVKVPFEPLPGLIAVTTTRRLDAKDTDELFKAAAEFGLRGLEPTPALQHENTWLFEGPTDEAAQEQVFLGLTKHPLVRRVGPVLTREKDRVLYLTSELIVKFRAHVVREAVPEIAAEYGLEVVRTLPVAGNAFLLRWNKPPAMALLEVCESLVRSGDVEYAEPNLAITAEDFQINPTDFLYPEQWHIPIVQLPEAWETLNEINANRTFGDPSIIIAVFDHGIQSQAVDGNATPAHPDFQGTLTNGANKVYRFYDFENMEPNNNYLSCDHGMGCASVAAARANNPSAVAGVNEGVVGAAGNCQVMGIIRPFLGTVVQHSDAFLWMAGLNPGWVKDKDKDDDNYPVGTVFPDVPSPGADIITICFGVGGWPILGLLSDTIDYLTTYGRGGKGVLLFCSSGNGNTHLTTSSGLAAHPKTFAIGASSLADDGVTETFGTYSNFGEPLGSASGLLDLCAPSHDAYGVSGVEHNPPLSYGVIAAALPPDPGEDYNGNMPGNPAVRTTLSSNATAGATSLTVSGTSGFAAGQAVLIGNPGGAQTEATLITEVLSATQLSVKQLLCSHNTGAPVQGAAPNYKNNFGGTSSAAPLAAGIAALVLSANPSLTWVEVGEILRGTAVKIDAANTDATNRWVDVYGNDSSSPDYAGPFYSRRYGFGRIDADAAVTAAANYSFQRDILVRDNLADNGLGPSTGVFWEGVDIWVRNANDNVAPANYATHANTVHQDPIPEQSNWVYVRFQNIGKSPSYRFFVRVYLAHWPRTEFAYPDDFIPSVRPGGSPPSSLTRGTYLIGEAKVDSLDGLAEGQIAVEWPAALVPPRTLSIAGINVAWHPCLLVEVTPHDGFTPPGTHVWQNNNLAQKNISSSYYSATGDFAFAGLAGNLTSWSKFIVFQIQVKGPIPRSTPIYIRFLNKHVERYLVDEIERTKRRDVKPEQNEDTTAFRLIGKRSVKLVVPNVGLLPFIVEGNVRELPKNSTARVEVAQFDDSGWLSGGLIFEVKGPLE